MREMQLLPAQLVKKIQFSFERIWGEIDTDSENKHVLGLG